jgi:hypothetical protein
MGCMGPWWACSAHKSNRSVYCHNHARACPLPCLEFQSTCFALKSPAVTTGNPPSKQADRSEFSKCGNGESYVARTFADEEANLELPTSA